MLRGNQTRAPSTAPVLSASPPRRPCRPWLEALDTHAHALVLPITKAERAVLRDVLHVPTGRRPSIALGLHRRPQVRPGRQRLNRHDATHPIAYHEPRRAFTGCSASVTPRRRPIDTADLTDHPPQQIHPLATRWRTDGLPAQANRLTPASRLPRRRCTLRARCAGPSSQRVCP
jgi:hypothetical protein